jgi:SsrA-binding protein
LWGGIMNLKNQKKQKSSTPRFKQKTLSLVVATMIYFKGSRVKLEIALAKGKKLHDKRDTEAKRDVERKIQKGNYDF